MARACNGQAIWAARLKPAEIDGLRELLLEATALKDLAMWRRAKCVLGYIDGRAAMDLAKEIGVDRSAVATWIGWYNAEGADGLRTRALPGRSPRLTEEQLAEVSRVVEAGPQAAGFQSGMWTGALVGHRRDDWRCLLPQSHAPARHRVGDAYSQVVQVLVSGRRTTDVNSETTATSHHRT